MVWSTQLSESVGIKVVVGLGVGKLVVGTGDGAGVTVGIPEGKRDTVGAGDIVGSGDIVGAGDGGSMRHISNPE